MRRAAGSTVDVGVFGVSVGIAGLFVLWGVFFAENLAAVAGAVLGFLMGTLAGATAAICLLANGLEGLQQAAITSAAPFVLVMITMCYAHIKELRAEPGTAPDRLTAPEPERAATRPPGVPAPQQMRSEPEMRKR